MFGSSLPPFVCRKAHVLFTLFVFAWFAHSDVQHILCCYFVCPRLVHVYPMLLVSLDFPLLLAPLVYSNVYLYTIVCLIPLILSDLTITNFNLRIASVC
jgi:hypothetical protein